MSVAKSKSSVTRTAATMILGAGALVWACSSVAQPAPAAPAAPAAAAAAPAPAADQARAKATFESLCSSCHDASLATDARYNRDGWQQVIERMFGFGLAASDAQAKEVVDYLAKNYGAN